MTSDSSALVRVSPLTEQLGGEALGRTPQLGALQGHRTSDRLQSERAVAIVHPVVCLGAEGDLRVAVPGQERGDLRLQRALEQEAGDLLDRAGQVTAAGKTSSILRGHARSGLLF